MAQIDRPRPDPPNSRTIRSVGLAETTEHLRLGGGRDADAGVLDLDPKVLPAGRIGFGQDAADMLGFFQH